LATTNNEQVRYPGVVVARRTRQRPAVRPPKHTTRDASASAAEHEPPIRTGQGRKPGAVYSMACVLAGELASSNPRQVKKMAVWLQGKFARRDYHSQHDASPFANDHDHDMRQTMREVAHRQWPRRTRAKPVLRVQRISGLLKDLPSRNSRRVRCVSFDASSFGRRRPPWKSRDPAGERGSEEIGERFQWRGPRKGNQGRTRRPA